MRRISLDHTALRRNQTPHIRFLSALLVDSRVVAGEEDGDEEGKSLAMLPGNVDIRISLHTVSV